MLDNGDLVKSKSDSHLTILRRKEKCCSPRAAQAALVFFSEICVERRCALDSILVNLNKTISRFRAMFVLAGHNRSELVWFPGLSLVIWLQRMPLIGCWCHGQTVTAGDPIIWFLSPVSTLPLLSVSPSLCTVRPGHYHIFISLFSWEFPDCSLISPPELSNPDSRGLWEEIQGPRHILFQQFCSPSTQHPRLQMKNDLWNLVHVHTLAE